jgi:hypothetical protein
MGSKTLCGWSNPAYNHDGSRARGFWDWQQTRRRQPNDIKQIPTDVKQIPNDVKQMVCQSSASLTIIGWYMAIFEIRQEAGHIIT